MKKFNLFTRVLLTGVLFAAGAASAGAKHIKTDDGQTCMVIGENDDNGRTDTNSGLSSSVTAGSGGVSSSTTIDGKTTTTQTTGPSVSSSSGGSTVTSGDTTSSTSSSSSSGPE